MKFLPLLVLLPGLLLGCVTSSKKPSEGNDARTVLSPAFHFEPGMRVLVLPFQVTGNPDMTEDLAEADFLCSKLAEAGFVIVDSTLFRKHDPDLDGLLPDEDLASIRKRLDVTLIAQGAINYTVTGARSLFGKSYRYLESASVRMVDLATGEAVIIATGRDFRDSPAAVLGESIELALGVRQQ
jgi:hypothetical protein